MAPSPLFTAVLLAGALACGVVILVNRGSMAWPPNQLLSSLYTLAGCLALVGPFVLARGSASEGGLGEFLWMTGGLLIWVFDAVALLRGDWRAISWTTPLGRQTMGLTILAVLLAGWRCRLAARGWSWAWTNVTGWLLGLFWVGMALSTMWPARVATVATR
jgi:hypothetical protein